MCREMTERNGFSYEWDLCGGCYWIVEESIHDPTKDFGCVVCLSVGQTPRVLFPMYIGLRRTQCCVFCYKSVKCVEVMIFLF